MQTDKQKTVILEDYLRDKRDEIVWSLVVQGYTPSQISRMFSTLGRSNTHKIVTACPKNYRSPWVKRPIES